MNSFLNRIAGAINVAATSGAKHLSHTFGLVVVFAISTNLTQYVAWKSLTRIGNHWNRYGPTYLLALSVPFVSIDYVRHLILDNHLAIGDHLHMYKDGTHRQTGLPDLSRLSAVGWTITIVCTYLGYILMIIGVFWATGLKQKIVDAFKQVRRAQKEAKEKQQTADADGQEPLIATNNHV